MSDPARPGRAHVAILMATYQGAECLAEQLDSLATQDHADWQLLVSDDGSCDGTQALVAEFAAARAGRQEVHLLDGPGQGAAANFLSLVRRAPDHVPVGCWLAFCDQDDVWLPDRLSRGLAMLRDESRPALYCARTWVVDHDLSHRRLSPPRRKPPGFLNALAQNIVAGNTILLNPAAARLVMAAAPEVGRVVMHDWWVYQLVTGAGGVVCHDDGPVLLYRQHEANAVGANTGPRAKLRRLSGLLRGEFRDWNDINIAALEASRARLDGVGQAALAEFAALRRRAVPCRLRGVFRLGLYRQTLAGTLALWLATLLGRL